MWSVPFHLATLIRSVLFNLVSFLWFVPFDVLCSGFFGHSSLTCFVFMWPVPFCLIFFSWSLWFEQFLFICSLWWFVLVYLVSSLWAGLFDLVTLICCLCYVLYCFLWSVVFDLVCLVLPILFDLITFIWPHPFWPVLLSLMWSAPFVLVSDLISLWFVCLFVCLASSLLSGLFDLVSSFSSVPFNVFFFWFIRSVFFDKVPLICFVMVSLDSSLWSDHFDLVTPLFTCSDQSVLFSLIWSKKEILNAFCCFFVHPAFKIQSAIVMNLSGNLRAGPVWGTRKNRFCAPSSGCFLEMKGRK